ncbi:hypothetical protein DER46DRAFT_87340 [Fusarium sp. MPI-SDFR-AT-0072]|nr:hypothetical protein DER46DRAFT_87340 [Fusarium sp. MPI-SDFR-AT-0072]
MGKCFTVVVGGVGLLIVMLLMLSWSDDGCVCFCGWINTPIPALDMHVQVIWIIPRCMSYNSIAESVLVLVWPCDWTWVIAGYFLYAHSFIRY